MKRGIILAFALLMITPFLALAQEGTQATGSPLDKEIKLPDFLKLPARILLGINENEPLNSQKLAVILAVLLILFLAFWDIVSMFSTFSDTTSLIISLGMTIAAGVTRVADLLASVFLKLGITAVIIIFIVLTAAAMIVRVITKNIKSNKEITQARLEGLKTGASMRTAQEFGETINKAAE